MRGKRRLGGLWLSWLFGVLGWGGFDGVSWLCSVNGVFGGGIWVSRTTARSAIAGVHYAVLLKARDCPSCYSSPADPDSLAWDITIMRRRGSLSTKKQTVWAPIQTVLRPDPDGLTPGPDSLGRQSDSLGLEKTEPPRGK